MPSAAKQREWVFFKLFSYAISKQLNVLEVDAAINPAMGLLERGLSVNKAVEVGMAYVAIISAQKILDSLKVGVS